MNTETFSTNSLAERLKGLGITSGRKLAQYTESPAVIYFLAKDEYGNDHPRAELHYSGKTDVFRPHGPGKRTLSAVRQQTVGDAQGAAAKLLGLADWHKTPFSNCWLPVSAINRMRAELGTDPMD